MGRVHANWGETKRLRTSALRLWSTGSRQRVCPRITEPSKQGSLQLYQRRNASWRFFGTHFFVWKQKVAITKITHQSVIELPLHAFMSWYLGRTKAIFGHTKELCYVSQPSPPIWPYMDILRPVRMFVIIGIWETADMFLPQILTGILTKPCSYQWRYLWYVTNGEVCET